MIFVTVGTEKFPFNRLMCWLEILKENNFISPEKEEIFVQYGSSTTVPTGVTAYSLLPPKEFKSMLQQARCIVAHCGEGSLDILSELEIPFILVPRSYSFGEHVDDHQIELAKGLEKLGLPIAYCPGDLIRFFNAPVYSKIEYTPKKAMTIVAGLLNKRFS